MQFRFLSFLTCLLYHNLSNHTMTSNMFCVCLLSLTIFQVTDKCLLSARSHMTSNMFCVKFCSNIKLGLLCRDDMEQQYRPSGSGWCCFGIIYLRSVCCKIFQKPRVQSFVYDCTWVGCGVQRTLVDVVWINGIDLHLQGGWCSDGLSEHPRLVWNLDTLWSPIGPLGEIDRVARFSLESTCTRKGKSWIEQCCCSLTNSCSGLCRGCCVRACAESSHYYESHAASLPGYKRKFLKKIKDYKRRKRLN